MEKNYGVFDANKNRTITDHLVDGIDGDRLDIFTIDEPGAGGANHAYLIQNHYTNRVQGEVNFQNGPIKGNGINGVTQEALLAIVIDRLRSFQAGPYSCRDNAIALTHCEEALMWLQRRTRERIKRGVEGTLAK
jgi:hypothetical protein